MENSTLAAWIGAGGAIAAAGIGVAKGWFKKPKDDNQVTAQTGDISGSVVAVGNNNTQITGTVNNYHAPATQPMGSFDGKVASRPSADEIWAAIRAGETPFVRQQILSNYKGLKVSWPVVFSSLSPRRDGVWTVSFSPPKRQDYETVMTDVDIDKYPELKVIKTGHLAWIIGTIDYVSYPLISLEDDAEITFER
jgi:hypothetical protein